MAGLFRLRTLPDTGRRAKTPIQGKTWHLFAGIRHARLRCSLVLATLLCAWLWPLQASAEPLNFRRPRMTFSFGLDAFDHFVGPFGQAAGVGLSAYAEAMLQVGYFAGGIRIGSGRGMTNKDFLPFDQGYQYVYLTATPRFYWAPFRRQLVYFFIQPEVSMHVMMSNTLVKVTGNDSLSWAVGGGLGMQYIIGILSLSGRVSCLYDTRYGSVMVTGGLAIGITSLIR